MESNKEAKISFLLQGRSASKVMMIEPLDDGGIAHYAFNLADALTRQGVGVVLFTTRDFELAERTTWSTYAVMFRFASMMVKRFPWLSRETAVPSIFRRIMKLMEYPVNTVQSVLVARRERAGIIHVQTVNLVELLMILALKAAGHKVVFTIHNVLPRHQRLRSYHRTLYRFLYGLCDQLVIHTHAGKKEVAELFSVDPNKISVIPHGDYKFFVRDDGMTPLLAKARLGLSNNRTLLFFGAIRSNKGLDTLLKALPLVRDRIPDVKLLIVGEVCENYGKYRSIIEQEGLQEAVYEKLEYIPSDDVGMYFHASDIVVLPYNEITQSGVLQIAYAFGKPVVATDLEGFTEAIEDGVNGFLIRRDDLPGLADRIIEIIMDDRKRESMGNRSRFLSDNNYSWEAIAAQTARIYDGLSSLR